MKESLRSTSGKSLPWFKRLVAGEVSVAKSVDWLSDCRIIKKKTPRNASGRDNILFIFDSHEPL